jgi:NAD(P)-dependent dehydrogenase (short-subunit alcohol dehydrogenase family)
MPRLARKVAFITGAGSGIGRATAILFAREGAKVTIAEIDPQAGEDTAHLAGNEAIAIRADVTDPDSLQAAIRATVDKFGRLDVLHTMPAVRLRRTILRSMRRSMNSGARSSSTFTAHFSAAGLAYPNSSRLAAVR